MNDPMDPRGMVNLVGSAAERARNGRSGPGKALAWIFLVLVAAGIIAIATSVVVTIAH
jgi:hypothetical protein